MHSTTRATTSWRQRPQTKRVSAMASRTRISIWARVVAGLELMCERSVVAGYQFSRMAVHQQEDAGAE